MGKSVRMNRTQEGQKLQVFEIGSHGLVGACLLHACRKDVRRVTVHYVNTPVWLGCAELWSIGRKKGLTQNSSSCSSLGSPDSYRTRHRIHTLHARKLWQTFPSRFECLQGRGQSVLKCYSFVFGLVGGKAGSD